MRVYTFTNVEFRSIGLLQRRLLLVLATATVSQVADSPTL